jgi:hypothetical protein
MSNPDSIEKWKHENLSLNDIHFMNIMFAENHKILNEYEFARTIDYYIDDPENDVIDLDFLKFIELKLAGRVTELQFSHILDKYMMNEYFYLTEKQLQYVIDSKTISEEKIKIVESKIKKHVFIKEFCLLFIKTTIFSVVMSGVVVLLGCFVI